MSMQTKTEDGMPLILKVDELQQISNMYNSEMKCELKLYGDGYIRFTIKPRKQGKKNHWWQFSKKEVK